MNEKFIITDFLHFSLTHELISVVFTTLTRK